MEDIIRKYKDELQLLEQQLETRRNMNTDNQQLLQGYVIRIQMIKVFLEELMEIRKDFIAQDNMIGSYKEKVQTVIETHDQEMEGLRKMYTEKIAYLNDENVVLQKQLQKRTIGKK